jgi:hypothetical protein
MKNVRIILGTIALVLAIFWLYEVDFNHLSWDKNRSSYIGLLTSGFILLSQILEFKKLKNIQSNRKS